MFEEELKCEVLEMVQTYLILCWRGGIFLYYTGGCLSFEVQTKINNSWIVSISLSLPPFSLSLSLSLSL